VKEVQATVNGVETTLLLSDEDASKFDEAGYQRKKQDADAGTTATKARKTTENK
jgi:hypothetical protein